jgi:hypothetical protein
MSVLRALAIVALVGSGCATTVVETAPEPTVVTTGQPSVLPDDLESLLGLLVERAGEVASAMNAGDRDRAAERLADLGPVWERIEPLAAERGRVFRNDVSRLVEMATSAVERNRPADADKALRFLSLLLDGEG